jgi:hypothetical protein
MVILIACEFLTNDRTKEPLARQNTGETPVPPEKFTGAELAKDLVAKFKAICFCHRSFGR